MNAPTWATIIGTLMLLVGGCGMLNNFQKINAPAAIDQTEEIFDHIVDELEGNEENKVETVNATDSLTDGDISDNDTMRLNAQEELILNSVKGFLDSSDYYKVWT